MLKKSIAAVLALTMLPMYAITAFGDSVKQTDLTQKEELLISALGIESITIENADRLTRAEFSQLLAGAYYEYGIYTENDIEFYDVAEADEAYNAVMMLKEDGIVTGNDGFFEPDDSILYDHAKIMAKRTLYVAEGAMDKEIPTAYDTYVNTEISKKVIPNSDGTITLSAAKKLIANLMNMQVQGLYDTPEYAPILAEHQKNLYYCNGIVTSEEIGSSNNKVSIPGLEIIAENDNSGFFGSTAAENDENKVVIGSTEYINESGKAGFLGYDVLGYYKVIDNENVLISVEKSGRNNEIFLSRRNIEKFDPSSKQYFYYEREDDTRTKNVKVPTDAVIVYNGATVKVDDSEFTKESYLPDNGNVTLLDNDNDGSYEYAFIYNYQTGVVTQTDITAEKIFLKDKTEPVDFEDKNVTMFNPDGEIITIGELAEDDVLLIAETYDKTAVKIIMERNVSLDIVKSVDKEEKIINTKEGIEYVYSDYFEKNGLNTLINSRTYNFYFDAFGQVAYAVQLADNAWSYAYIKELSKDDEDIDAVKLLDQSGAEKKFTLADKVIIYMPDGSKVTKKYEAVPEILNENVMKKYSTHPTLVRYKINSEMKIKEIEIPLSESCDRSKISTERLYVMGNETSLMCSISGSKAVLGGKILINEETVIFNADESPNYDVYPGKVGQILANKSYNLVAYATDRETSIPDAVILLNSNVESTLIYSTSMAIQDVEEVYSDERDEIVTRIHGYSGTTEKSFEFTGEDLVDGIRNFKGDSVSLSAGDIILYSSNTRTNSVNGIILVYDYDCKNSKGTGIFSTRKGMISGMDAEYFNGGTGIYGTPFNYEPTDGTLNTSSTDAFNVNGRVFAGMIYNLTEDYVTITNQDVLKNGYNSQLSALEKNQYRTDSIFQSSLTNRVLKLTDSGKSKVDMTKIDIGECKSYVKNGNAANKVIVFYKSWQPTAVYVIDEA